MSPRASSLARLMVAERAGASALSDVSSIQMGCASHFIDDLPNPVRPRRTELPLEVSAS